MPTPDARPGTEGAGETAEQLIVAALMAADICSQHECAGAGSCPECTALAAKAVCAALLRDAPVVWVATSQTRRTRVFQHKTHAERFVASGEPALQVDMSPLTPPGTVRRYALVPIEEGT